MHISEPIPHIYKYSASLLLIFVISIFSLNAQSITPPLSIEGQAKLVPSVVIPASKKDVNGMQVAGIKVLTNLSSLSFDASNGVVEVQKETGAFVVFVSANERKITVGATGFLPLDIILSEIGIRLQSGQLWELAVTGEQKVEQIPVNFVIEPSGDGVKLSVDDEEKVGLRNIPLSLGSHLIRLEKKGSKTIEQQVEVSLQNSLFSYTLSDIDPQVVSFTSIPSGATVYVDEIEIGQAPVQVFYFPGSYKIEWRLSGYLSQSRQIQVSEEVNNSFSATLSKNTGTLRWTTNPPKAQVSINNQSRQGNIVDLAPGMYKIEVSAEGYDSFTETIEIQRGKQFNKGWTLKQQLGGLQFSVQPTTAQVQLEKDGVVVEKWQGLKFSREIPVGSYQIKVSANGYLTKEKNINISQNVVTETGLILNKGLDMSKNFTNSIGMEFVYVAPGSFKMGNDNGSVTEKPEHTVELTKGFYISKHEVTQKQWKIINGSNYSRFQGDNLPVDKVSFYSAISFIRKLNELEGSGFYRLPTEAEWEYCAKGGNGSNGYKYSGSNWIWDVAWFEDNSDGKTHKIGSKLPNELGIYDMSGNVWEWCSDWYDEDYYFNSPIENPEGPEDRFYKVIRGGSATNETLDAKVSVRNGNRPSNGNDYLLGFRVVYIKK